METLWSHAGKCNVNIHMAKLMGKSFYFTTILFVWSFKSTSYYEIQGYESEVSWSPKFVLDPPREAALMQNPIDHETLYMTCHIGTYLGLLIHSNSLGHSTC
jgi:hypothetical protein